MQLENFSLEQLFGFIAQENGIDFYNILIYQHLDQYAEDPYNNPFEWYDILQGNWVSPEKLLQGLKELDQETKDLQRLCGGRYCAGVTSKILLKDSAVHLLMLDFNVPKQIASPEEIEEEITLANLSPGFLLDSGNSYHYYGVQLVPYQKLLQTMDMIEGSARLNRLVDDTWMQYLCFREFGVLRLSTNEAKPFLPTVVRAVGFREINPLQPSFPFTETDISDRLGNYVLPTNK